VHEKDRDIAISFTLGKVFGQCKQKKRRSQEDIPQQYESILFFMLDKFEIMFEGSWVRRLGFHNFLFLEIFRKYFVLQSG
jgi:hypothetical protein